MNPKKERHMKVLHICTSDSGGAGLCCVRIHEALLRQGVDSKVLVLYRSRDAAPGVFRYGRLRSLLARLAGRVVCKLRLPLNDEDRALLLSADTRKCYTVPVSRFDISGHPLVRQADVIHLHWINRFVDYPSFFAKVRKPMVWTLHDENLFLGIAHYRADVLGGNQLEARYREVKRAAVSKSGQLGIAFLSKMMYDEFAGNEMVAGRPMVVINNSVDSSKFHPVGKAEARKAFGIPQDALVFAFVSATLSDPRKGLRVLSETLQRMRLPRAMVLAVGNVGAGEAWPLVKAVGAIHDVERMSMAYSCADYFVMPSVQEAFAQTPIEAMACGVPTIVFPVSGTEELITAGNGVRCQGFTSADLEAGISEAVATSYDGEAIRKDMATRFSPEVIAGKYLGFYNEVMRLA